MASVCVVRRTAVRGRERIDRAQRVEDPLPRSSREKPGTAAICSGVASRMACTLPKALSSSRRLLSPTPGMRSSSDVMVRTAATLALEGDREAMRLVARLLQHAQRRRATRQPQRLAAAEEEDLFLALGEAGDRQRTESEFLAALSAAALSWPLPPSMSTRSGSGRSSSRRRRK